MNFLRNNLLPVLIVAVTIIIVMMYAVKVVQKTSVEVTETLVVFRDGIIRFVEFGERFVNAAEKIPEAIKSWRLFRDEAGVQEFIDDASVWDISPSPTVEVQKPVKTPEPVARSDCSDENCPPQYQYQRDRWGRTIKVKVTP